MEVNLMSHTLAPLSTIYTAARTCYHPDGPSKIKITDVKVEDMYKLISKCISSNHLSVLEHANFTFSIEGISRACSHQLVRHRMASYSQKSQRYVKDKEAFKYVVPPSIAKHSSKELKALYDSYMASASSLYNCLIQCGVKPEDARYVYPNACETSLVVTMNLRELMHFCNERMCSKAQWEIRLVAKAMAEAVIADSPFLEDVLKPKCFALKRCPEEKSCGLYERKCGNELS